MCPRGSLQYRQKKAPATCTGGLGTYQRFTFLRGPHGLALVAFGQRGLCCRKARDRHAVRGAGYVAHADLSAPYCTVQLPRFCSSPLFRTPSQSCTPAQIVLAPSNAGWNVRSTVMVRVLPETLTVDGAPFSVHWLFFSVPAAPGCSGPIHPPLLSVSRLN